MNRVYCLDRDTLLHSFSTGPQSLQYLEPTHYVSKGGKLLQRPSSQKKNGQTTPSPDIESPQTGSTVTTGLFGSTSSSLWWLPSEEMNVVVWDRLPREDYDDIEMPSKVSFYL